MSASAAPTASVREADAPGGDDGEGGTAAGRASNLRRTVPLLFFGLTMLVLGVWLAATHAAVYLGRTAFWPYLVVIGGLALAGGGASSVVEWGASNRAGDTPDFRLGPNEVIVPKSEWEEWLRHRAAPPALAAPIVPSESPAPAVAIVPPAKEPVPEPTPLRPALPSITPPPLPSRAPAVVAAKVPSTLGPSVKVVPPRAPTADSAPVAGPAVDSVARELERALEELKPPAPSRRPSRRPRAAAGRAELTCVGCYSRKVLPGQGTSCRSCGQAMCDDCAEQSAGGRNPGLCPICSNIIDRAMRE